MLAAHALSPLVSAPRGTAPSAMTLADLMRRHKQLCQLLRQNIDLVSAKLLSNSQSPEGQRHIN